MARRKEVSKLTIASEAVAVTFFIMANAAVALGEFTDLFVRFGDPHGGVQFVYEYLCPVVYPLVHPYVGERAMDMFGVLLVAEFVIILSSFVYGLVCWAALKLVSLLII